MNIQDIIYVNIALQNIPNNIPAFGTTLLMTRSAPLTPSLPWTVDTVRQYTSYEGVLGDWSPTSPVSYFAADYFEQSPASSILLVGIIDSPVAQISTVTINSVLNSGTYSVTINGFTATATAMSSGSTVDSIATALGTALGILFGAQNINCSESVSGAVVQIEGGSAGQGFSISIGGTAVGDMTAATGTPAVNLTTSCQAIKASGPLGSAWYCVELDSSSQVSTFEMYALSDYIETQPNIFVAFDYQTAAGTTPSWSSYCQTKKYNRTLTNQTAQPAANQYPEAALASLNLTYTPGSKNWAYSTLEGITPDTFSETVIAEINALNSNYYVATGGENVYFQGKTPGGSWIDIVTGADWIKFNIQNGLLSLLINTPKVPYTDQGINMVANVVRNVLNQAVALGILAVSAAMPLGYIINVPTAASISQTQKNTRVLNNLTFSGNVSGGINAIVPINGTIGIF